MNLQQRCSSVLKIGTQLFVLLLITLGSDRTFACQSADSAADVPVRNVLFIVSDDLRAGVLRCYGDAKCQTPNIDKLASESVVFTSAYCQGTVCGPSRTSFMYGRYQGKRKATLAEYFQQNSRYTARVGKIFHMRVPGDIIAGTDGEDVLASWTERFNSQGNEAHTPGDYACLNLNIFTNELAGRQSTKMPHRMFVSVKCDGDGQDQPDYKTATTTIELLNAHHSEPFFIAAGFVRPHYPMVAPTKYFDRYPWEEMMVPEQRDGDLDDIPWPGITNSRSALNGIDRFPDNQQRMWQAYYASVTFMDEQVGRILDELERLNLRQSTAIVFISDHGYHLGDHTFWQKSNLHEQVTRVPMMISVPGISAGRSDSIVELVDLFPTLCEVAGLPIPNDLHGVSLLPVLKNTAATVKEGAVSFAKGASWRTSDWSFMQYPDGSAELYDMHNDPGQFTNLAEDSRYQAVRSKLSQQLQAASKKFKFNMKDR
ncbi:MAG: sulfatase [Fuerstiella sp.]